MKDKQAKYPQLRFKGFTDPWAQRKLGDLGDILRKSIDPQLTPSREFVEYSMPSYDRGKRPNRVLGESMQSTRLKISGTVLLINKLNVRQRRIWFVKKAPENAVASGEFVPFQSFEIDLGFLHQLFLSDKTTSELQSISSGTSNSQKRVTPSDLLHYPICIPTTKGEQVVVGRFLSSIDNTITLHQRKLAKLKELKQGYLQKMFPQNGSKFPQLRFTGFADAWEQRKLTEIVNRVNKSSNSDVLPKVEFEDIVSGEGRLNKDISSKLDSRKGTLFESENILYGKLRPYLKNWLFPDFEGVALGDFWVFEATDVSVPSFDYYLIQSDDYQKVANNTSGTKMPRSDWKNISSTDFAIPSKDEQKQIGAFFKQLDDTITLHQRKLEKLQELKKGYLQKMFC
ncbi:restriction endonuclease subunit S [Lactobacillus sp. LC28-10]|uniref:Restriction endonuclease subunit S n=1 Tax=Secundilactobacillus angelensis TaxID=2722706 RepID=A0ABX1KZD6_9LACO|nr:restriction endonuclease subunit S [Secundilactobacillus angelensis]MCH5463327.1 restriction endonuclease subunit S [Secundilactobacillus angelensis]NLR19302.1 restriction endonuclease subunit S [Secundilactobacillus angelensis]